VTVVTSDAALPAAYRAGRGIHRSTLDRISLLVIGVEYSNEMSNARRMVSFARFATLASWCASRVKADLLFATSTPLTIAIPGLVSRAVQRAPLVFEVRDLWPEMPIAVGALRNPIARLMATALEWFAYHGSEHIIALSPGMAAGVVERGISPDRVTVIPNGCDNGRFDVPESVGRAVRASVPGLRPGVPLVVYAGTLGLVNGVEYLAELAAAVRSINSEVRFLVLGEGKYKGSLVEKARDLGVLDATMYVRPPVPKKAMPEVFAAATAVMSTFAPIEAMEKNSANKFFDGLAAGRPLIVNYGGWQAEILEESGAGIRVSGTDAEGAAADLVAFVTDPVRLRLARDAARSLSRERFDRDLLFGLLIEVFERVVQGRRG
jgi:glycosyltransferase involved in cell wall biosynthesis